MDITGWISGQVFFNTVDETEVERITAYLNERGIATQLMQTNEQMALNATDPDQAVTSTSYSIAAPLAGFPQVLAPILSDLMQRAHGGGWDLQTPLG